MLREIIDFGREYPRILRGLEVMPAARYVAKTAQLLPAILRDRKLAPLDREMRGDLRIKYRGKELVFPLDRIEAALAETNDSPTFGAVREMFFNDVYLWPFRPMTVRTVIDLGANRCFFGLIACVALGAEKYAAVEPLAKYDAVADTIFPANGISPNRVKIYRKFAAGHDDDEHVSVRQIVSDLGLQTIDLLKVDIEGGEYEAFRDPDWLDRVKVLVMEVHPPAASKEALFARLREAGFHAFCVDTHRDRTTPDRAEYIFAARDASVFLPGLKP